MDPTLKRTVHPEYPDMTNSRLPSTGSISTATTVTILKPLKKTLGLPTVTTSTIAAAHATCHYPGTMGTEMTGDCPMTNVLSFGFEMTNPNTEMTNSSSFLVPITVTPGVTELPSLVMAVDGAIGDKYNLNIESTV